MLTLYKGPTIGPDGSEHNHNQDQQSSPPTKNWIIGSSFIVTGSLCVAIMLISQAAILKWYPSEFTLVSFYCFFATIQCAVVSLAAERNYLGLAIRKTVTIQPGGKDLSVVLATTKTKKQNKPASLLHKSNMRKEFSKMAKSVVNQGLEVIEVHYLFGAEYDDIEIVIHPQSIIHSMIETHDSSVLAKLGWPDMRFPILYTMSWPDRVYYSEITWPRLDLYKLGSLTFKAPDNVKYPSMDLAYATGWAGGTMTGVLSATNEKVVEMFIDEKFLDSQMRKKLYMEYWING